MKQPKSPIFPWGLAFIALLSIAIGALNWTYHNQVRDNLQRIERNEDSHMMTTKWVSDGKAREWTSRWKEYDEAETLEKFLERHDDEVEAALRKWPEDPQ